MFINNLKKIWIISLVFSVIAGYVLYRANQQRQESLRGNLVFSSATSLSEIKKIEIISPKQTITLYSDDHLWRVAEADNYYADVNLIASLQEAIAQAKTGNILKNQGQASDQWTTLNIFDQQNKLLDSIQINEATKVGRHYIRYSQDKDIYLSNWVQMLPDEVNAWTNKKLVNFEEIDIWRIEKDGVVISRRNQGAIFIDDRTHFPYRRFEDRSVFEGLAHMWYDKVCSSQEFDESKYTNQEHIRLDTFDGLITNLYIYTDYQEYWLKIELTTDKLPSYEVVEYVNNNKFLYTDWWFRIPATDGRMLFMTKL